MLDQTSPETDLTPIDENLSYTGTGSVLAMIMFKNLALTIFTLGIYLPWGRTNMRRYLWGNVSFLGDRASYTGTGSELFKGWLVVVFVYFIVAVVANLLGKLQPFFLLVTVPLYIYVYALAMYGGTRYRLARTSWREISFTMQRNKVSTQLFILTVAKGLLLTGLTLGIYYPFFQNECRKFLVNRSGFGTAGFNYDGTNNEFAKLFFKNLALTILTLGFYGPWMLLNLTKFKMKHMNLNNTVYFDINLTGKQVFVFALGSYLATILTFGLALPWVLNWGYSLFINAIHIKGELDFTKIRYIASEESAIGDVVAVEYDLEFGF